MSSNHYECCVYHKHPDTSCKYYHCEFYNCNRCSSCHCPSNNKPCKKKNKTELTWYKHPFKLHNIEFDYTNLYFKHICLSDIVSMTLTKNVMKNVVDIKQCDFVTGPYIIKKPGYYRICENIVFSPNKYGDGKPTTEWLNNLDEKYRQAYVLGFFAMIVIQCDNVILDLNNHTLEQSELFFHQQTFYSHIELASTPFILGQGPANFGEHEKVASNVVIKNGCLGKSSHHGIHAPGYSKNIILDNLTFHEFAVAAIHLNGAHNVYINNIDIDNRNMKIKFNSLLSQAQFILSFLEKIDQTERIFLGSKLNTVKNVTDALKNEIKLVYDSLKSKDVQYPKNGLFHNEGGLDANMYGIVLNSKGIAINGFKSLKEDYDCGNNNIVLNDVSIKNIQSKGTEIKCLSSKKTIVTNNYGGSAIVGPAGDVFDFTRIVDENGFYNGNLYSDAQIIIAKFLKTRSNIPEEIIEWASGLTQQTFESLISESEFYVIDGRDSMAHVMKGNIALFCSQAYRMIGNKICIQNIQNDSSSSTKDVCGCYGILYTGCKNINVDEYSIYNVISKKGINADLMYKNDNINIQS